MTIDMLKNIENDKFASFIGVELVEVKPGYAVTRLPITDNHLNGVGLVQGGAIFTLADYAFAAAANSRGIVTVGINASITYFKAPQGKVLTAVAREVSGEKRICGYCVDIFDEDRSLIARLSATGYIKR